MRRRVEIADPERPRAANRSERRFVVERAEEVAERRTAQRDAGGRSGATQELASGHWLHADMLADRLRPVVDFALVRDRFGSIRSSRATRTATPAALASVRAIPPAAPG